MARSTSVTPLRPIHDPDSPYNPQAQICLSCSVRQFALFGALDERALERIHLHISSVRFEPGQVIYAAEESGSALFTVRRGVLRLERTSRSGERRILRLAGRTDLVGLEAILGQTYAADAVACTEVEACRIPRTLIDELAAAHPKAVHQDLMKRWQRALDDADEWLTELARGSARHRMLCLLLKLSEYSDGDGMIWLPTRLEMGAMLDLTFETASRLVSALRKESIMTQIDARTALLSMPQLLLKLSEEQSAK